MRVTNLNLFSALDATAAHTSDPIDCTQVICNSYVATGSSSTINGLVYVEVSNDICTTGQDAGFVPTNWAILVSNSFTGSSSLNLQRVNTNMPFRWCRIRWGYTSGTGTITINYFSQSA